MKVALGISSGKGAATIALLDAAPPHALIDQYRVDLAVEPISSLVSTLASTERDLTQSGHRLVCTRISSADTGQAETLANALAGAALSDVAVVSETDAVAELARSLSGDQTTAAVVIEGDTASLAIVDPRTDTSSLIAIERIRNGDRVSAYSALLERFHEEPGGATSVLVLGSSDAVEATSRSPIAVSVPVVIPDDPEFAVARGAALMAFRSGLNGSNGHDGNGLADAATMLGPQMQQLAYSEASDSGEFPAFPGSVPTQTPMRPLSAVDLDALESDTADDPPVRPRVLLIGSTVAAVVVVGFAALAVTVAINIRPAVSEQAVRIQDEAVPGKYFPQAPGQGVKPDGENWTVVEKLPPPGQTRDVRVFEPRSLTPVSSAAQSAPVELQLYSDGTLGMGGIPPAARPAAPLPDAGGVLPSVAPAGPLPDGGVAGTGLVARLIPDLSKIDMTQVITALINKPRQSNPLAAMATTLASLNNAGSIGVVKANQGPILTGKPVEVLSDSPAAIVKQLAAGANAATLATAPKEIPAAPVLGGPPIQRAPDVTTPDVPAEEVEMSGPSSTAPGAKTPTVSTSEARTSGAQTSEAKTTTARPSPEQTPATKAPESSPSKSSAPSSAPSSESSTAKAPTTGGASTANSAAPSPADVAPPSSRSAPETSQAPAPVSTPSVASRAPARVTPEPTSEPEPEPAPVVQAPAPVVEAPPAPAAVAPAPVVVAPPPPAVVAPAPVPVAPPPPPPAPAPAAPAPAPAAPAPAAPAPAVELPLPRIKLPLITTTAVPAPGDPSS